MSTFARRIIGVLLGVISLVAADAISNRGFYGWTLFVLLPMFLGGLASWIFNPETGMRAAGWGAITVIAALSIFFLVGREGLGCIAVVLPLTVPFGALGGWLAYWIRSSKAGTTGVAMLLLLPAASFSCDTTAIPAVFEVHSSIEIAAPPEQVWKHVLSFSEMPSPQEWVFRTGLAYPTRARMEGSGAGAMRYCDLSTGPVVERIEVWDAPRLLRFRVIETPAPMEEWSPYGQVEPKHLRGYLVSEFGEFRLTRLANNGTLLEGTSWYRHGLWPAQYWRWWSDAIVHRIHMRVLNHIRALAERG